MPQHRSPQGSRPRLATAALSAPRCARTLWLGVALALGAAFGGTALAQEVRAPLSAPQFFRAPDIGDATLSPNGRKLALTVAFKGHIALAVLQLDGPMVPKLVAAYDDADVGDFYWVDDERLVYAFGEYELRGQVHMYGPGLLAVNADGSDPRTLINSAGRPVAQHGRLNPDHQLLFVPQDGSGEVIVGRLIENNQEGGWAEVAPMRLNTRTAERRNLALGMPDGARSWWFDRLGEPRVAAATRGGQTRMHWRAPGSNSWRELARMPSTQRTWWPHAVDTAGTLYVTVPGGAQRTDSLRRFDFARGEPQADAVVNAPGFDFRGVLVNDRVTGRALGVQVETDAASTVWFDARMATLQAEVDRQLPGRVNQLRCRRCDSADAVVLVQSWSDQHPGEYWLFWPGRDAAAPPGPQARWQPIGDVRRDIDPRRMATVDFHRFTARDGLSIPLWLTVPPGAAKDKRPRPAVVLVHDGPWQRGGHWAWSSMAQFLASRGWVVLAPEFRGSAGYGETLYEAGRKQWGRAMQDDLADTVKWAAAQAQVDPKRVCIVGAGYGGYAALMAPLRHPGVFRCAVVRQGITDPRLMMRDDWMQSYGDEYRRFTLPALIGDPTADAALLDEASPSLLAARWEIPLLMAYGSDAYTASVPIAQGETFRDALRAAGKPAPEWIGYDVGSFWSKQALRIDFAQRMADFLARHLD